MPAKPAKTVKKDSSPVTLLWGTDPFLLRDAALRLFGDARPREIDGPEWSGSELGDLSTPSLFGEQRSLLVTDCRELTKEAWTDIGTYLAWKSKVELVPLVQADPELYNVYHVLEPNPRNAPRINVAGGRAFADFMVDTATQRLIGEFGRTRFGQALFVPDAGKTDRW